MCPPAGTFQDFLEREDLALLAQRFQFYTSLNGYGFIDKEAAYYGLLLQVPDWNKLQESQLHLETLNF